MLTISNRTLVGIAVLSGVAATLLILNTPVVQTIEVYQASQGLNPTDLVVVGQNVRTAGISIQEFSAAKGEKALIPASLKVLVDGRHMAKRVNSGQKLTIEDLAPVSGFRKPGSQSDEGYLRLAGLLLGNERAIAVSSDAITSFGFALEPGDVIDLVRPGGGGGTVPVYGVRVLAVGARTEHGWVASGPHEEKYTTITLAVDASRAEEIAQFFGTGYDRPKAILHPASGAGAR